MTDMPEPTQWDNSDGNKPDGIEACLPTPGGGASELKDHLDSIPCTESEDSMSDE